MKGKERDGCEIIEIISMEIINKCKILRLIIKTQQGSSP